MKQLLLIRHCEADGQGRYIGRSDPSLTEAGVAQAHKLAERLNQRLCTGGRFLVLSSPARRCLETASLFTQGTELLIEQDSDLWEVDFGRWDGWHFSEISANDPTLVDEWAKGRMDFRFPDGESLSDFWMRIKRVGCRIRRRQNDMIVIFTHGGVVRFLLCFFLALPPSSHHIFQIDIGSIAHIHLYDT